MTQQVLVVSIDGVAPRYVDHETMPHLLALARQGASSFTASTVIPSITLPAHTSMLRGIDPSVHGIMDNTPLPLADEWPSFLRVARSAGQRTAAVLNWAPIDAIVERDAADHRFVLDGGYGGAEDDATVASMTVAMLQQRPQVTFSYLVSPDLAGHDHGWGSAEYLDALRTSDTALGQMLAALTDDVAVLVTTDHGGHGTDHQQSQPEDIETFMVLRAAGVAPATRWDAASVLDVAPTVAELCGIDGPPVWSGRSLLGREEPIVDHLLSLVEEMAEHHYGEDLTMREHSLQTAAVLAEQGATRELCLAGLLHDVGHLLGDAGEWGLPDHAAVGARYLQAWLPEAVVAPIRLHVDAKRHLVTTDAAYAAVLSQASTETLQQQGGPFSAEECSAFITQDWAGHAVTLRTADDAGKTPDADAGDSARWRQDLHTVLTTQPPSPMALRNRCMCAECRDSHSGQRLLTAGDLDGWHVRGWRHDAWELAHHDGRTHRVVEAPSAAPAAPSSGAIQYRSVHDVDGYRQDLVNAGIAIARGLQASPGAVLEFAATHGFVRSTNYGDLFDVRNEPDATNLAYTTLALPLHSDNPYRDPCPTVQILHCLVAAETGGDSTFRDGLAAAEQLRRDDPAAFDQLATTDVRFAYQSDAAWLEATRPLIATDNQGGVTSVAVNHRSMQAR